MSNKQLKIFRVIIARLFFHQYQQVLCQMVLLKRSWFDGICEPEAAAAMVSVRVRPRSKCNKDWIQLTSL
jgi:hypothetical protein